MRFLDFTPGLFNGQFTTAQVGEDEAPNCAERGRVPLPEFFFDFGSEYGEFWCILDGIFLQFSYLFYMQKRAPTPIVSKMPMSDCGKVTAKPG